MVKLLALVVCLAFAVAPAAANDVRAVDLKASRATFGVQHALIERVTGSVPIVAATVTVDADGVTPTAVDATLDPRRIDSGDGDRDGDLQGPDWFDTKRFPTWTFASTRVAPGPDGTLAVSGVLTLHGVAVPLTLATTIVRGQAAPAYHAVAHVDRHAFGMTITRTDALVGGDVEIVLDIRLAAPGGESRTPSRA